MNLDAFCFKGEDSARYDLDKPFRLSGWMYATNKVILVRVPSPGCKTGRKVPPAAEAFEGFLADDCNTAWPAHISHDDMRDSKCPHCHEDIGLALPPQRIAGRRIAGYYWWLIASLGRVTYSPAGKPGDPLQFTCGELQGIVMPLEDKQ